MQKIKDKSKKIKVSNIPTIFNILFTGFILLIVLHNVLNLLSLSPDTPDASVRIFDAVGISLRSTFIFCLFRCI